MTPLSLAIQEEKIGMIPDLVAAGADVDGLEKGRTQLRNAASGGLKEVVDALLLAGADPNVNNTDEMTPLRAAAGGGGCTMPMSICLMRLCPAAVPPTVAFYWFLLLAVRCRPQHDREGVDR